MIQLSRSLFVTWYQSSRFRSIHHSSLRWPISAASGVASGADVYDNVYSRMDSNALGSLSTAAPLMYTVDIQFFTQYD